MKTEDSQLVYEKKCLSIISTALFNIGEAMDDVKEGYLGSEMKRLAVFLVLAIDSDHSDRMLYKRLVKVRIKRISKMLGTSYPLSCSELDKAIITIDKFL